MWWCDTGDYCVLKKVKCSGELPCRVCDRKRLVCTFSVKQRPGPKVRAMRTEVERIKTGKNNVTNTNTPFVGEKSSGWEQTTHSEAESDNGGKCAPFRKGAALVYMKNEEKTYDATNALLSLKYARHVP